MQPARGGPDHPQEQEGQTREGQYPKTKQSEQGVVSPYTGILYSHKKEQSTDTRDNITSKPLQEVKGIRLKRSHMGGSHLSEISGLDKSVKTENRLVVTGDRKGDGKWRVTA